MSLKIRLSRCGSKKRPCYRIVVADALSPRDGDFKEKIGFYNPILKTNDKNRLELNVERLNHWLKVGAQPTDIIIKFIINLGIDTPNYLNKKIKQVSKKIQ